MDGIFAIGSLLCVMFGTTRVVFDRGRALSSLKLEICGDIGI